MTEPARVIRAEGLAEDEGRALLGVSKGAPPAPKKDTATRTAASETALTQTEQALGGALSQMVKPVVRRGTRLIDLYVVNQDPALAQRLAEAVGREYIRSSIERRANFAEDTLKIPLIASRKWTASAPASPTLNNAAERPTKVKSNPRVRKTPAKVPAHLS